ncbi:MAG: hypothetical protein IKD37_08415 [Clostridia bacterium]|nr:hypothetical protein [Clostridia bacterium]
MAKQGKGRRMAAPIVITVLFLLYCLGYALACWLIPGMPLVLRLIFGVVPLALAGVLIFVLVERIKEIRSGEEDDLSQY